MGDVSANSLIVASPRRRGRPKVDEPLKPVTTWVPPAYLDRLDALALKHDVSVSKFVRRAIEDALRKP